MTEPTKSTPSESQPAPVAATPQNISGRGVFVVENLKYARVAEVMALVRSEGIARLSFVVLTKN